jgi:hypothetical protein
LGGTQNISENNPAIGIDARHCYIIAIGIAAKHDTWIGRGAGLRWLFDARSARIARNARRPLA